MHVQFGPGLLSLILTLYSAVIRVRVKFGLLVRVHLSPSLFAFAIETMSTAVDEMLDKGEGLMHVHLNLCLHGSNAETGEAV